MKIFDFRKEIFLMKQELDDTSPEHSPSNPTLSVRLDTDET